MKNAPDNLDDPVQSLVYYMSHSRRNVRVHKKNYTKNQGVGHD